MNTRSIRVNPWGQPIGQEVPGWRPPSRPESKPLAGRHCRLEPLNADRHADELWDAWNERPSESHWTYLPYGPFPTADAHREWIRQSSASSDPLFLAVIDLHSGRASGWVAWMRITPETGCLEVGHIVLAPRLQRQTAATEALFLLIGEAFRLGFRRVEWKCDALNAPSRAAALRLGFQFEGIFRQALVYRGRNRDTAWYSVLDHEWVHLLPGYTRWLAPENFGFDGVQRERLGVFLRPSTTAGSP